MRLGIPLASKDGDLCDAALAPSNSFEQRGEVSLGLADTNFLGYCILRLV